MKDGVLVDTSAWIDFFRRRDGNVGDTVADLVERDQAILAGPVMAELLRGVRGSKEAAQLKTLLGALPYVEVQRLDWEAAGKSLRELRSRGLTLALTDAVIAAVASRYGLPVLTLDKDFEHLSVALV
jgi:predicted nucleic acid-binding protein